MKPHACSVRHVSITRVCSLLPVLACFLVAASIGCSRYRQDKWTRARPETHPARVVVTYRGAPVEGAIVTFLTTLSDRQRDYDAVGYTGRDGACRMKTFREGDGAVAGIHRVRIEKTSFELGPGGEASGGGRLVNALPRRYASFGTSGLSAEVIPKMRNEFHFELDDVSTTKRKN